MRLRQGLEAELWRVLRHIPRQNVLPNSRLTFMSGMPHLAGLRVGTWDGPECVYREEPEPVRRRKGCHVPAARPACLSTYLLPRRPVVLLLLQHQKRLRSVPHSCTVTGNHETVVDRVVGVLDLPMVE